MLQNYIADPMFWQHAGPVDLELVVKVAERCNLACDYCYFFYHGDESYKEHPAIMPKRIMDSFVSFLEHANMHIPLRNVRIVFHGGEPLMMPISRYRYLCSKLLSVMGEGKVSFGIQTNATLVNEEWIQLFSDFKMHVGVSLDGPKHINDLHRVDHQGRGSYDSVIAGLSLLKQASLAGRIGMPGIIYVINPDVDVTEVYDHITKDLGCKTCHFLLPDEHHGTFNAEKASAYTNTLMALYKHWAKDENPVRLRFFADKIDAMKSSVEHKSLLSPLSSLRKPILSISSQGDIGPNDALRGANPAFMASGLSVVNHSLLDVLLSPHFHPIWLREVGVPTACLDCDWQAVCRGGHDTVNTYNPKTKALDARSVYCGAYQQFYEELALSMLEAGVDESILNNALWGKSYDHDTVLPD